MFSIKKSKRKVIRNYTLNKTKCYLAYILTELTTTNNNNKISKKKYLQYLTNSHMKLLINLNVRGSALLVKLVERKIECNEINRLISANNKGGKCRI